MVSTNFKSKIQRTKWNWVIITATPLYCEHTGQDISIPYNNNTANMHLTVHNYIGNNYTIEDIDYTISIESSNYTFTIDGNKFSIW